jgi:DNA-binding PadR family transcriptional regulator
VAVGRAGTVIAEKECLTAWLLLLLDRGPTYGYGLHRELRAHEIGADQSAIYRALRALERDKLVRSSWTEPVSGPRRRNYRLDAEGRQRLDEIAELITAARDRHDRFLREHTRSAARRAERAAG